MCHDYYHAFDDYRSEYQSKFGKRPFEGIVAKYRWYYFLFYSIDKEL